MTNLILIWVVCSTVITTLINFSKPAYEWVVKKKYVWTISIALAFALWILAAFSIDTWIELSVGLKILAWLTMGTGSTIWYDFWKLLKSFEKKEPTEE